jgi:hypothetical protein
MPEMGDLIGKVVTYSGYGGIMRATTITLSAISLLFTGIFSFSRAQTVQPAATQPVPWHPCAQIRAACTKAGFIPNGAKMGLGIEVDCIQPIIFGTPQRAQAAKPLPPSDPQVVAACKARSPNFGMDGGEPLYAMRTLR